MSKDMKVFKGTLTFEAEVYILAKDKNEAKKHANYLTLNQWEDYGGEDLWIDIHESSIEDAEACWGPSSALVGDDNREIRAIKQMLQEEDFSEREEELARLQVKLEL